MEELLQVLVKDAHAAKFQPIRSAAQLALDTLSTQSEAEKLAAFELREKCLLPLHLALESKTKRLMTHALSGIEKMLKDERFQSSLESASEDQWLPLQILSTVYSTPNLPEEIQADVMKLLLKMALSTAWCMNTKIVTRISQVFIDTYTCSGSSCNLRGLVQAALAQLLGSYSERLTSALKHGVSTAADVMSDFNPKEDHVAERLMSDVVSLLYFLSEKITMAMKAGQCKQAVPLLLEGVLAILTNSPEKLQTFTEFQQLVWQSLCPTLISLLGMPKSDKGKPAGDPSKNMDSTLLSPTTAKIIYSISVQICKMLGPVQSLRPVLESLFHRMLICSSPLQRHDAVKAIRELLSDPRKLCDISVAYVEDERNGSKPAKKTNDLALIKLFMESIRECCHTSDSSLCFTCVLCVSDLLTSIQQLDNGCGLHDDSVKVIERKYLRTQDKRLSLSERAISVTSQSDIEDPPLNTNNSNVYNNSDANNLNKTANTSNSLENGEFLKSTKNDCKLGTIETKNSNHTENTSEDGKEKSDDVIDNHKTEEKVSEQTAKVRENTGSKVKERSNPRESLSDGMKLGENEKKSARCFIDELARTIPHLLSLYTVTDVDEALQEFASDFAENNMGQLESQVGTDGHLTTMLNADSIYSTSYAVLCLSLHLHMNNFHTLGHRSLIPVTEGAFQDSVLDTDMFLYLSPDWLSYVYQAILAEDILEPFTGILEDDSPLVWALTDIDGDSSLGGQMMRNSVSRMQEEIVVTGHNVQHAQAGKLIANQILQACWDSILDILTTVLSGKSVIGATNMLAIMIGTDGAKEETLRRRDALCKCLDGLQIAAKLCCSLGLQERCESVFTLLANTSCVMEDLIHASQVSPGERAGQKGGTLMPQAKPKLVTLHASHVLSMDAIMTTGLEIGSHSIACWKQVFRCCAFISELERTYFSGGNNQSSLPRIQQEQSTPMVAALEEGEDDIYTIPLTPIVPVAPKINVATLIAQSSIESGWDRAKSGAGELNSVQASQALCGLSQQVDRVFEDAANNLNMRALSGFLSSLCEASKQQLQKLSRKLAELEEHPTDTPITPLNSLHLYRLQSVLIKVAHSNRPLIHIIKAWSVVSAYLVESAGHRDRSVSKMAVACVHDFIITVMSTHSELGHFHTNEMLCKTFENILCLELCDGDVQDQIVCSICELVEASASDVKSGWRPLFGALRAVRIEYTTVEEVNEARQRHIEAVLDVFDVYLNTDNIVVFASATVDCILCLLKYVRGPGEFSDSDTDDSDSELEYQVVSTSCGNLCLPALQYLRQCSLILQSMLNMPACPVFHGAKRIQVDALSRCIDTVIPNINFKTFSEHFTPYHENGAIAESSEMLPPISGTENVDELPSGDSASLLSNDSGILISKSDSESSKMATESSKMATKSKMAARLVPERIVGLDDLDKPSGILHVWFLLLEGMSGAVSSCPREFQPKTMEMLFELLRAASHVPGPEFAMFCSKHLLFPMIQSWLRSGARKFGYWEIGATNFKQCCGHTTDLIVDLIHEFKDHADLSGQLEDVLSQLLTVLRECVASPTEVISRLGCSCIRHILLSGHNDFTESMWSIVISSIECAIDLTTYSLKQLMLLFKENSENFYGDIGQVKVATRKDCTLAEFVRTWHLAQQVFLLDSQVSVELPSVEDSEDKSYVFLLYPPGYENSLNPDHILARVPFRNIVVGLLSHQLLLQTIGCILLEGDNSSTTSDKHMPGMLSQLPAGNVIKLLDCLMRSYQLACDFDSRPGLKFLVQKVAHTPVAVNLYKQAGASMVFYIHTLIKICSHLPDLDKKSVRALLAKTDGGKNEESEKVLEEKKPSGLNIESIENQNEEDKNEHDCELKGDQYNDENEPKIHSAQNMDKAEQSSIGENEKTFPSKSLTNTPTSIGALFSKTENSSSAGMLQGLKITNNSSYFVNKLKLVCDNLCQTYMDILYDKAGTSIVDTMADQQLFFLIAQPDEFPEVRASKVKVDPGSLSKKLEQTTARLQGQSTVTQAAGVQDDFTEVVSLGEKTEKLQELSFLEEEPTKSKREMRTDSESRVYNLVTDKLIKNLMTEYKKRKSQNAMPTFSKVSKSDKKADKCKKKQPSCDPVEQVIEQQQQTSIMKDSEAHLQSWTELLCTILGLFQQLSNDRFTSLLPTVFSAVNHLVCHAQDMRLKEELAQWLHRVGQLYELGTEDMSIVSSSTPSA